MKKILGIALAVALVFCVAGNASARITAGMFTASVNDGSTELLAVLDDTNDGLDVAGPVNNYFDLATDLTNVTTYAGLTFGGATGNVTGSGLEYYDAFVAVSGSPTIDAPYASGVISGSQTMNPNSTEFNGRTDVQTPHGTQGYMGSLGNEARGLVGPGYTIDLGAFDAWAPGDVITLSMDIWHIADDYYGYNGWATQVDTGYDLTITRNSDGSISTAIAPVPVPGALILLGSGLMALIGVRRKNS